MAVGSHMMPSEIFDTCTDGTFSCLSQWAYQVTNGTFFIFILLAFCVSVFIASAALGSKRSFGWASFIALIGSVWLAVQGLMAWWIASMFIIVGLIGLAMMVMDERR